MDKEEIATSQKSTLASSEQTKATLQEEQPIYLQKRAGAECAEFDQLIKSTSESGKLLKPPLTTVVMSANDVGSDEADQKQAGTDQKGDIPSDIGISRKRLIRNRHSFVEKQTPDQKETKCSNANCSVVFKKDNPRLYKARLFSETAYYCEDCSTSIRKKWTCPFCKSIYTNPAHSTNKDAQTWIHCDGKKCGRWTHLECEGKHRMQDLKSCINDDAYKFYCSDCFELLKSHDYAPSTRKNSEYACTKAEVQVVLPSTADIADYHRTMASTSKFELLTNYPYFYLYSEAYQPISRLVQDSRRSSELENKSLQLSDHDLAKDFARSGIEVAGGFELSHGHKKSSELNSYRKKHYRAAAMEGKF